MMFHSFVNMMPLLAESTDQLLRRADIMNYIIVPVAIVIMFLGAIFGKKDK